VITPGSVDARAQVATSVIAHPHVAAWGRVAGALESSSGVVTSGGEAAYGVLLARLFDYSVVA